MKKSPITAYIDGGSRMQAFSRDFTLLGIASDPDFKDQPLFEYNWVCKDIIRQ